MTPIFFLIVAAFAVICAISLVSQTHPIASALSLVGVMGALALLYLQLGAEFLAAAQMIVYAGAIMVLFVFVIMLLNAGAETEAKATSRLARFSGMLMMAAFLGIISFVIQAQLPKTAGVTFGAWVGGTAQEIGILLFTTYLLPFEVTSVLILIALVGAIVLARKEI
jgi:NADH-quinone oxidoreductase subunit J